MLPDLLILQALFDGSSITVENNCKRREREENIQRHDSLENTRAAALRGLEKIRAMQWRVHVEEELVRDVVGTWSHDGAATTIGHTDARP